MCKVISFEIGTNLNEHYYKQTNRIFFFIIIITRNGL